MKVQWLHWTPWALGVRVRARPSFSVELCLVIAVCLNTLRISRSVRMFYLQFPMLLIFVPAQQAQLLPAHLRDHCTLQFPTLLFEDAVAHLKDIREERCAGLSWEWLRGWGWVDQMQELLWEENCPLETSIKQHTSFMLLQHSSQKLWCNVLEVKNCIIYFTGISLLVLGFWGPFFHQENLPCPFKSFLLYLDSCLHSPIYWLWAPCLLHWAWSSSCMGWCDKHFLLPLEPGKLLKGRVSISPVLLSVWFLCCITHTLGHSLGGTEMLPLHSTLQTAQHAG